MRVGLSLSCALLLAGLAAAFGPQPIVYHPPYLTQAQFLPDGKHILGLFLTSTNTGMGWTHAALLDAATGQEVRKPFEMDAAPTALLPGGLALSAIDGDPGAEIHKGARQVPSGASGLTVWDVSTGKAVRTFLPPIPEVSALAVSADGTAALTGHKNGQLILWDVATGRRRRTFDAEELDPRSSGSWVGSVWFS